MDHLHVSTEPAYGIGHVRRGDSPRAARAAVSWRNVTASPLRAAALALSLCAICSSQALAATRVWTGAGAGNLTTTAANWSGGVVPVAGDDLVFPSGVLKLDISNSFPVSTSFHSLRFTPNAGVPYTFSGNGIVIVDHIQVDSGLATVSAPVTLAAGANVLLNVLNAGDLTISGQINGPVSAALNKIGQGRATLTGNNLYAGTTFITAGTLRVQNNQALGSIGANTILFAAGVLEFDLADATIGEPLATFDGGILLVSKTTTLTGPISLGSGTLVYVNPAFILYVDAQISGAGTFTKDGDGAMMLRNTQHNTFGAPGQPAVVKAGTLILAAFLLTKTDKIPFVALPNGVSIGIGPSAATVSYRAPDQIEGPVVVNSGGVLDLQINADTITSLTGVAGAVVNIWSGGQLTLTSGSFAGSIIGAGSLHQSGAGLLLLSGTDALTGQTTVAGGTLQVDGVVSGLVILSGAAPGVLCGAGTVGPVSLMNATITPGTAATPGVLHTHSVLLESTDTFALRALGTPAGMLDVTGTVSLNGATLHVDGAAGAQATPGHPIVLIANDGSDPIGGTFGGLPEGAAVTVNGALFQISYTGGDGNDVVLVPVPTYYLSEGSTGGFFTTDVLLANPNATAAPIHVTFFTQQNGVVSKDLVLPAMSRTTLRLNDMPEIGDGAVSTTVTSSSGVPLIVERTMTWDKSGYGAHGEKAVGGLSSIWYFAEGSQGFFSTYVLLANPQTTANNATVTYLREGTTPLIRTYALAPQSRTTIDLGADAGLVGQSFGMQVQFDLPGVAERAMYFGTNPLWNGGHESAGATQPSPTWLLAEGATGPFFETFILLANPNTTDAQVTVTFLPASGAPVTKMKTVPANSRLTINIEGEDPALGNAAVGTQIQSSVPILAERSQYWPDPAPQWYEAHNSFGVTAAGTKWGLAEGRVGQAPAYQTYILLANPGATLAHVTIQFLREHGGATITKTFTVPAASRLNVSAGPGADVPELADENFGAILTSDQPIAVERSMYANANGQVWAAGTNATATPLP